MGDTFAVMRTLEQAAPGSAVIIGAGYIGLEMAEALTSRGLQVTQMEQLSEVCRPWTPSSAPSSTPAGRARRPGPDRHERAAAQPGRYGRGARLRVDAATLTATR